MGLDIAQSGLPEVIVQAVPDEILHKKADHHNLPDQILIVEGSPNNPVGHQMQALLQGMKRSLTNLNVETSPKAAALSSWTKDCEQAVRGQELVLILADPPAFLNGLIESDRKQSPLSLQHIEVLLKAAEGAGVKRVVFCSDASVVSDGSSHSGVTEEAQYPQTYGSPEIAAVAGAEKAVLAANGRGGMKTCAVRPSNVYGPEDRAFLPGLVNGAKKGQLRHQVGGGGNTADFCFSGNAAHAVLLAAGRLQTDPAVAGAAVFITDGEPVLLYDFINRTLNGLGYHGPTKQMPYLLALLLAYLWRLAAVMLGVFLKLSPSLTPARVKAGVRQRYHSTQKARELLGYEPLWSPQEALNITLQSAASLRNPLAPVKAVGPFTRAEVARHCREEDLWLIVDGKVYDVTDYLSQHPGGDAMLRNAGGDSSEGFHGPQHPAQAAEILAERYIGELLD